MRKITRTPGVEGSFFELLVSGGERLEAIPWLVFILMLFGIAWILTKFARIPVLPLWGFFLLDWSLMAALPRLEISFGPSKPPTLLLALLRAPFALIPSPWLWAIQSVGTLLVIYGFFIEPQQLIVTHRILRTIKLGAGVRLRLLHVGDLHLERITKRERELVAVVESLKPDLILFSGDILSYSCVQDDEARAQARSIMNAFKAPLGVFAVAGSPPVDTRQVLGAVYRDTKIELLERQTVELDLQSGVVRITGLACTHDMMHDGAELQSLPLIDPSHYQILLYHSPDLAPQASALGYDLQLSGHTHGGQVRLPFFGALYTSSIHGKRFEAGEYVLDRMKLYVTRGLGLEGKAAPRVRFLCPPEIVLLEITGINEESGLTHRGERYPGDCLT